MKNVFHWVLMIALIAMTAFGTAVYADFEDLDGHYSKESVHALQQAGIINGINEQRYAPEDTMTYAQGVHLIVKAFDLNMDALKFIKEPLASDYYEHVPNDAWYASSFVAAQLNGLSIPKDADPNSVITREQFAHLLMEGVHKTGDYMFIKIFMLIEDEADIDPALMGNIQTLLISKITKLNDERKFMPKEPMTRGEAAVWLHQAVQFVKGHAAMPEPQPGDEVTMQVEAVNEEVNKVTLSWGTKPSSGYHIEVRSIEFTDEGEALIHYELSYPKKDMFYLTVITEPKAVTYVSSAYKPTAVPVPEAAAAPLSGHGAGADPSGDIAS
jgi:hypothetical protein